MALRKTGLEATSQEKYAAFGPIGTNINELSFRRHAA
jgi:hypothetical protein